MLEVTELGPPSIDILIFYVSNSTEISFSNEYLIT